MSYQLSSEEIEKLFDFVESKNVPWRDVQFEIVDHLATEMEEKMSMNPQMSFNSALGEVYGKFPITGFVHMVASQEKVMKKYWGKQSWKLILEYFKLSKLIITVSLVGIMYLIINQFQLTGLIFVYGFTLLTVAAGYLVGRNRGDFKEDNPDKKLMFAKIMNGINAGVDIQILWMPVYIFDSFNNGGTLSTIMLYLTIIYFGFSIIWTHAHVYRIPDLIKEEYNRKYNHLNIKLA